MLKSGITTIVALAALIAASAALGQSATGSGGKEARDPARTESQGVAAGAARADMASNLSFEDPLRRRIETHGTRVGADELAKAEVRIDQTAQEVDHTASAQGEVRVAQRLAAEFGMNSDAIQVEKNALGASWGNLMIAHSISANSNADVTVASLLDLRRSGTGWGRIAAGLDLRLGSVVSAIRNEGRVASGIAWPAGHVQPMRGPGARVGVSTGLGGGLDMGHGRAGLGEGVRAGVKVRP